MALNKDRSWSWECHVCDPGNWHWLGPGHAFIAWRLRPGGIFIIYLYYKYILHYIFHSKYIHNFIIWWKYLIHSTVVYLVENNIRNMKLINSETVVGRTFYETQKSSSSRAFHATRCYLCPSIYIIFFFDCF